MPDTLSPPEVLSVADAARQRRSVRAFDPTPVPRYDLDAIFDVVRRAPSAFNAQPWRFVVVASPGMRERLLPAANNQRQVRSAPVTVVLYTDMADALATAEETVHADTPADRRAASAAKLGEIYRPKSESEREAWAYAQGHIALGYLLLAAEAHGYQTSPMAGFDEAAVKRLLGLPPASRVVALVALGRGAEPGRDHHRHALGRLVRYA
jgi:nitroreductase